MRKILKLILISGIIGISISCGTKESSDNSRETGKSTSEKIKVKVGTEGVFIPFTFTDETGKLTGYDMEVVEEIEKRVGLDVEFIPIPWDSMFWVWNQKI